jgi:oligopeptide transport system substrate-binding protein
MHKRFLGILASLAVIVAACGGTPASVAPSTSSAPVASGASSAPASTGPSAPANLADDQTLNITLGNEDPATLDPTLASTSTSIGVLHALNRGLIYFDKDQNPVPSLAEALPTISADGLTYTFKLRDAKYSNGDPIVAADLVYAWKRLIDPRTAAKYQAFLADVAGGQALVDMTAAPPADAAVEAALAKFGVAAPDPKTFVVTLEHPTGYFLDIVALWGAAPIQEKWVKTPQFTEAANYVSSGPFMMKTWTHQAEIVLVPNPNWYGQKPYLQNLVYKIGGDPTANQASFEAGDIDMLAANPPDVPRIKADADLGPLVKTAPVLVFDYWGFDSSSETTYRGKPHTPGPTANKHFRRALSMAIDKDTMMATVYGGQGIVAGSPIPPGMPGHQPEIGLKYDVTAAKAELDIALKELGYATAADVPTLSFGFNTDAGHEVTSAYMQEQWSKNLGIKSELKGTTFDTFVDERPQLKYSIARNAWGADYPHPDNFLRALFQSQSGNNDEGYNNPEFDRLVAEASAATDATKANELYNKAQELLVEDAPAVWTRWRVWNNEIRPWVKGVTPTGQDSFVMGDLFFETIYIEKH